jgi:hypothetical protein
VQSADSIVRRPVVTAQEEREASMFRSVKALLVCGALLAAGLGAAAPAAASAAASESCTVTISDIHGGTVNGQATVSFTGQVGCNYSTTSIELHTAVYSCGSQQPDASKNYLAGNCGNHTSMETFTPEQSGVTYTISSFTDTATGSGYYVSELNYFIPAGGSNHGPNYGTPAYCTLSGGAATCTNVEFAK